ncbi:hypothetical protein [Helicobacter pylori]
MSKPHNKRSWRSLYFEFAFLGLKVIVSEFAFLGLKVIVSVKR